MRAVTEKMGSPFLPPVDCFEGQRHPEWLAGVLSRGQRWLAAAHVKQGSRGGPHLARDSALPPFPLTCCPDITPSTWSIDLGLASGSGASDSSARGAKLPSAAVCHQI